MLLRLGGPEEQDFDLDGRYGAQAGTADGQDDAVSSEVTADELINMANPQAGTYDIRVHSYRGAGSYTLEVDVA
ncbi:MAG TPA: pre-peptidase C-terminal domain-containing protein [Alphaproteobacteria bacterium]|nr:pre-peptidase C-terminal domain-containing protein [Alphaproteobacteria bacterium]